MTMTADIFVGFWGFSARSELQMIMFEWLSITNDFLKEHELVVAKAD